MKMATVRYIYLTLRHLNIKKLNQSHWFDRGMEFNRNNKSLGLTINTFQSPSDAHVLDLKSNPLGYGSLTRWTFSEVGGLDTSKFIEPELIHYLHLMAERFLHLYTPIRLKNLNR